MSNTTNLSSYADSAVDITFSCVEKIASGANKLAQVTRWLQEELQASQQEKDLKRQHRAETLICAKPPRLDKPAAIQSFNLHLTRSDQLLRSAQALGYQILPQLASSKSMSLQNTKGERIAIMRNSTGTLTMLTGGRRERIHSLVRQHTTDQTLIFLKKKNMQFKTAKLANGEVQILAKEQSSANEDGPAELKVQIRRDGNAWVDIDKIKGNRCEKIVADLAQTIGAKASGSMKKEAYYQLPGEPTKTNLRI